MAPEGKSPSEGTPPERDIKIHRNRLAGLWAAELLGLIGKAAHDYAHDLVHAHDHDGAVPDDDSVARRLAQDLKDRVSAPEIREKLTHLLHEARKQLRPRNDG